MFYTVEKVLAASAERTESGQSREIDVSEFLEGQVVAEVTATAGTDETLDLAVQSSADGTLWINHTTFTQFTAAGSAVKLLTNLGKRLRLSWTVGGTDPAFTFAVKFVGKGRS